MVRYGDQEQSSPGGAQYPQGTPQAPAARTPQEPAQREGASAPDRQTGRETRLAEQDDPHQVPQPRQAPSRRAGLLRRPESRRAIPSLARFLGQASFEPGDARIGQDPAVRAAEDGREDAGQDTPADRGERSSWDEGFDWDEGASRGTVARSDAVLRADRPGSSAAELRDLAELSDLLTELGGLVHDLGALIIGLMTVATGAGGRQVRTFAIPPELAELAVAHQELKAGQQALNARFEASGSQQERAALRASLAALTERATQAVCAAAAAVTPQGVESSGRPSEETTRRGSHDHR